MRVAIRRIGSTCKPLQTSQDAFAHQLAEAFPDRHPRAECGMVQREAWNQDDGPPAGRTGCELPGCGRTCRRRLPKSGLLNDALRSRSMVGLRLLPRPAPNPNYTSKHQQNAATLCRDHCVRVRLREAMSPCSRLRQPSLRPFPGGGNNDTPPAWQTRTSAACSWQGLLALLPRLWSLKPNGGTRHLLATGLLVSSNQMQQGAQDQFQNNYYLASSRAGCSILRLLHERAKSQRQAQGCAHSIASTPQQSLAR